MEMTTAQQITTRIKACADKVLAGAVRQATAKADGSLVTQTDMLMQSAIGELLVTLVPGPALLGEEMTKERQRALLEESPSCWVLDPIDGTSNFSADIPFYCISLALVEGGVTRYGLVYDPCRDECFWAVRGEGAWLNGVRLTQAAPLPLARCIGLIDMKRLNKGLGQALLDASPVHSMRNLGAIALEWCWLAAGRGQVYLHGKQQLWDYAAAQLILHEAGGRALDLEGHSPEPLTLAPRGMIGASSPELLGEWREWISRHQG
jgi:myo-inositol-1(or 4)-monophosphatase